MSSPCDGWTVRSFLFNGHVPSERPSQRGMVRDEESTHVELWMYVTPQKQLKYRICLSAAILSSRNDYSIVDDVLLYFNNTLLWMHAQRASMLYFADVFFYIFFMAALVGQTAERIFTKLSHVVDISCYLRTYQINLFLALLNYTVGQNMTKFCIFLTPPVPFQLSRPNAAKYRNSKKNWFTAEGCSTLVPISTNFGLQTPEI